MFFFLFQVIAIHKYQIYHISRYDNLKIFSGSNQQFRVYCGQKTGQTVLVTGDYASIAFHSGLAVQGRGFSLVFNLVPLCKYNNNNDDDDDDDYDDCDDDDDDDVKQKQQQQ